jgi:ribonuclease HI
MYIDAIMTPTGGEAWGIQQAMRWMEMLGHHKVIFKMDCKMVVHEVHRKK